jgi:hypothetical protein
MAKTPWSEVAARPEAWHLLVGRLDDTFGGGRCESDTFDTARVRFAVNLMARYCSNCAAQGVVALQGGRDGCDTLVKVALNDASDFRRLSLVTAGEPAPAGEWKAQAGFVLDEPLHRQLLKVAGAPDSRGAGRRARERQVAEQDDRSLRWRVSSRERL